MKVPLALIALLGGALVAASSLARGQFLPPTQVPWTASPQDPPPGEPEEQAKAELFIMVQDEDEEPIFKASVSLNVPERVMEEGHKKGQTSFAVATVRTDPEGEAVLELDAGEARTLSVSCRALSAETRRIVIEPLEPGESREIVVRLRTKDDAVFHGRVVDDVTGAPVAGVDVQESANDGMYSSRAVTLARSKQPTKTTAEDGSFQVDAATWRGKTVTLIMPGYAPSRCSIGGAEVFPGQDEPVELRLRSGSTVQVKLASATPGASVQVKFYGAVVDDPQTTVAGGGSWYSSYQVAGVPDPEGDGFVVHDLPPGAQATTVVSLGREVLMQRRFTAPEGGQSLTQSFDLSRDGRITGVLKTASGDPVPGHELVAAAAMGSGSMIRRSEDLVQTTTTAADGSFSFEGLTKRRYRVGVAMEYNPPIDALVVPTGIADLTPGSGEAAPLDLVLLEGMSIRGRLLGPDGEPTTGHIHAYQSGSGWSASTNTLGEDGVFEVGPLTPGTYSVRGMASRGEHASALPVDAEAGATDLVLKARLSGEIAGRIVDASTGESIAGEVYYMENPDGGRMTQGAGGAPTSDFSFTRIAAGTGHLIAVVEGVGMSAVTPVSIRAGETTQDVILRVAPAATVTVSPGAHADLAVVIVDVDGYKEYLRLAGEYAKREAEVPVGLAHVTFKVKDSEESYELRVQTQPGETVHVNADDATPVRPSTEPEDTSNPSEKGDNEPQPIQ